MTLHPAASRGRVLRRKGAPCCDWQTRGYGISGSPTTAVPTTCSFSRLPARGRLIRNRAGQWVMLAFRNLVAGSFVGEISDPMPVNWKADGSGLVAAGGGW